MVINHKISGITERFVGNGRALGYPTANLSAQVALPDGVYFGYADMGEYVHHPALIFVGTPTTMGDTTRRVEAHLLDIPDKDYYDLRLELDVRYFHRSNLTFGSINELTVAMKADEAAARKWFKSRT